MRQISNADLVLSTIPDVGAEWSVISDFAHTFDGYGSGVPFENAYDLREPGRDRTLTEWRAILFFTARSIRHCGTGITPEELRDVWAALARIRAKVEARQLD